jgi:hypothetical protein
MSTYCCSRSLYFGRCGKRVDVFRNGDGDLVVTELESLEACCPTNCLLERTKLSSFRLYLGPKWPWALTGPRPQTGPIKIEIRQKNTKKPKSEPCPNS